jgi:two-component system NarL family sensor kinase
VREGKTVYVEDARSDPRANNQFAQAFGMVSVLGVPVLSFGRVIGFILIDEPGRHHRFTDEDVRVMEGIAGFAAIAIENSRLYRESREQQERLSDLMLRLARTREDERSRISRELHDSMAQTLLEIIYRAEGLLGAEVGEHLRQELRGMLQSSRASLAELRRIITDLRPSSVEVLGLARAVSSLLDRYAVTYGLRIDKDIEEGLQLDSLYENSIFRMVQEALNNISRHAAAGRAGVSLRRDGEAIRLEVSDDGCGCDPASASDQGGLGLIFMRERAEMMGGSFEMVSGAGRGTVLRVEVPLS